MRERLTGDVQGIEQSHQRANQGRIQPADLIVRLDTIATFTHAHGVTQQHAPQARPPAVLLQPFGQAQAGALLGAQAPTDAGAFDPAMQGGQVALLDGEAGPYRWNIKQVEHLADRKTAVG